MVTNLTDYRVGNYLRFLGSKTVPARKQVEIAEKVLLDKEETFGFLLDSGSDEVFVAYKDQLRAMYLASDHLEKLGFRKTDDGFYALNSVLISRFLIDTPQGTSFMSNFHAVKPGFEKPKTPEQFLDNTVALQGIHTLQNFLEDVGEMPIDFVILKSLS